jgi:hypothetical protein
MIRQLIALVVLGLASFFACGSASAKTYAAALAECVASIPGVEPKDHSRCVEYGPDSDYPLGPTSHAHNGPTAGTFVLVKSNSWYTFIFDWGTKPPPPPTCKAGDFTAGAWPKGSSGFTCEAGCEAKATLGDPTGGSASGGMTKTGNTCSGSNTDPGLPGTAPPETTNADGSHTWCDQISGKCVTAMPAPPAPPPPPSDDPNNQTNTHTDTTEGPSTSTSDTSSHSDSTTTGDGSGTGTGSGSGSSTGTTDTTSHTSTSEPAHASSSDSKCTEGACDVGNADGDVGDLYKPGTDSPGSVYADFKASVSASPLMASTTGFFTVNASGSCPSWHIPGNKYWGEAGFDFTFFCSAAMMALLQLAGYIVLSYGAFRAFSIAIY